MPPAKKKPTSKPPLISKLSGRLAAKYGSLPKIPLPGDDELQRHFNANAALLLKSADLYRRATLPVSPFEGRLKEMKPASFVTWSQRYFVTYKLKQDRDGNPFETLKDMTESHAKLALADLEFLSALPRIHRTYPCPVPTITEQGILQLCTPGYDPATGTYVFTSNLEPLPPDPSRPPLPNLISSGGYFDDSMTLPDAFWTLYDTHSAFPFSDWTEEIIPADCDPLFRLDENGEPRKYRLSRSLSVQVGGMLSLFAANCVPREASRMGFIANANSQRSGKTLLVKIQTAPVYGSFKAQGWREDEEAMTKILDSEVLAASPYICFDNVRGLIQNQQLEGFFTAPLWTGRILGGNEMFTEENSAIIYITGNNVSPGTDIQHRCLFMDLHVEEADLQSREINATIIDDVWLADVENRRRLLSALWSIVRHWDAAGRPAATGKTRQGFDTWGKVIGGMVEHAMFGDMLERPELENAGDSESEDILTLVRELSKKSNIDFTWQEIVHTCWEHGLFPWNLQGKEETWPLRHEQGAPAVMTLKLSDKCQSRMGLLMKRHSGERGTVHSWKESGTIVRYRFHTRGQGRNKRYFTTKQ